MKGLWTGGEEYEAYVGRWSRAVAAEFLDWLEVSAGRRWVDVGCGTGALTEAILLHCDPAHVLSIDPSEQYLSWAASRVDDPRITFKVGSVADIDGTADLIVSGLVLNFMTDPTTAVSAMRAAATDGTVAAYVWDYADGMELMRWFWDAATELDPNAAVLDEGTRFGVCRPESLQAVWRDAGLVQVSHRAIDIPTVFRDFDDYWHPFLGGQGPAPGYVASLDEEQRSTLRESLRARLPIADDGSISLTACAWAIRGLSR